MLATLRIKNLALVSDLTLELEPGLNVITGETGAGKSVIIGALNLVLGQRADRTLIRSGEESCTVEAIFDVTKLQSPLSEYLQENGLESCEENQLLIKRSFTNAGTNRQFINGSATTLSVLGRRRRGHRWDAVEPKRGKTVATPSSRSRISRRRTKSVILGRRGRVGWAVFFLLAVEASG